MAEMTIDAKNVKPRLAAMCVLSGMMPIKREPNNAVSPYVMFHDGKNSVVVSTKKDISLEEVIQNLYVIMKANGLDKALIAGSDSVIKAYNEFIELPNESTLEAAFTEIEDGIARSYFRAAEEATHYENLEERMKREEGMRRSAQLEGTNAQAKVDQKIAIVKANEERLESIASSGFGFSGGFVSNVKEQVSGNLEAIQDKVEEIRRKRLKFVAPELN